MKKRKLKVETLTALGMAAVVIILLTLLGTVIYIAVHFIKKLW